MTIDSTDVGLWFSFTPGASDYPSVAQCNAYVAAAQNDFEAFTEVTFDESVAKHVTVLKWLIERHIKGFFKMQNKFAESYSMQGGSVSHQFQPIMYTREEIEDLIRQIKMGGQSAPFVISDDFKVW